MPYDKSKHKRAPNGYRELEHPWSLTEGAEKLLNIIKEFEHRRFLSTRQLGYLMHIPQRKIRKYLTELQSKKRILILPEDRKSRGRYHTNEYKVLEFNPEDHNWN